MSDDLARVQIQLPVSQRQQVVSLTAQMIRSMNDTTSNVINKPLRRPGADPFHRR